MKFKIDLHVHSKYSEDTDAEPEEIILRAIELGIHGVAFTEHYYYGSSEPVERLKEKYRDRLLVLRGVEFLTAEGHCLVFGVDTDKLLMNAAPIDDLIRIVNKAGGVVIPSHPYRPGTGIGDRVLTARGIAALEGCNGVNALDVDNKAIEAARALNISYTGGSDAHEPMEVGCCFTEFNEEVTYENFIGLLREGKCRGADTRKTTKMVMGNF